MFVITVEVKGPYRQQHLLVKIAAWLVCAAIVVFLNFVPVSVTVWLALDAPIGHRPITNWLLVLGILAGMFAVGAYCFTCMMRWLTGNRASAGKIIGQILVLTLASTTTSILAYMVGYWPEVFLILVATIPVCLLASAALTFAGQLLGRRHTDDAG